MKTKIILSGKSARLKLQQGVDLVADIIKTTLGPKGRNVIVRNLGPLPPRSMNDGYYIADYIQHDDAVINAGVDMVKEICKKTNDVAGDGTSSTAILSQSLIENGLKEVDKGKNPIDIKNELNKDLDNILEELKKLSTPIKDADDIKHIATISGNNDNEIGSALKEIYEKVGKNASIMVEKSNESKIRTETIKGIYFHRGFDEARVFVNNPKTMTAEYKDVRILCVDEKLEYSDDIVPFLEKLIAEYKNPLDLRLLVIANEIPVRMDAMTILAESCKAAMTRQKDITGFYCVAVQAPEMGAVRSEYLEDIAMAVGGVCVSKTNGLKLSEADPKKVLGRADKIIVNTNTTTIIGGNADKKLLDEYILKLKGEIAQLHINAKTTREKLEKRLQVISAGVGIIHAGAPTEVENKERYLRVEDAILAVQSAISDGVSVGGGWTYYKLAQNARTQLLKDACLSIPEQVAENAGKGRMDTLSKFKDNNIGYNALTDKFEDLLKAGVLDSTKVIKVALQNAVSLASLFLTTSSCVIEDVKDEDKK